MAIKSISYADIANAYLDYLHSNNVQTDSEQELDIIWQTVYADLLGR